MTTPRVAIETDQFSVVLTPTRGASLARLAWRHPDGDWRELMVRPTDAEIDDARGGLSAMSSFIMLPFANRIDGAAFVYDDVQHRVPLNRPSQNCAIHGLSREHVWTVASQDARSVTLEDVSARSDVPYRYRARHNVSVDGAAVTLGLSVENMGDAPMPFGFGLHPWFPRTDASTLQFASKTTFASDARTFPTVAEPVAAPFDFAEPITIATLPGIDRHYAGWDGVARIVQPDFGYALDMATPEKGAGGYRNIHIFCPTDREAFCAEPVTHVTDVVNRREFALFGDMARLSPGESLSASVRLTPRAL